MADKVEEIPCSRQSPTPMSADNSFEVVPTPATNQSPPHPGDAIFEDPAPQTLKSLAYKMRSILETKNKTISQLQRKNRQQAKQIGKLNLLVKRLRKLNKTGRCGTRALCKK